MLKYLTGLQLVGFGEAFPDTSNHFAHERKVFQAHSPRNGLFKREPDIVGQMRAAIATKASGLSSLPCERPLSLQPPDQREIANKALRKGRTGLSFSVLMASCYGWVVGYNSSPDFVEWVANHPIRPAQVGTAVRPAPRSNAGPSTSPTFKPIQNIPTGRKTLSRSRTIPRLPNPQGRYDLSA